MATERQLQQVLEASTGQHGYWLVSHKEVIAEALQHYITKFGKDKVMQELHKPENNICASLYTLIDRARGER